MDCHLFKKSHALKGGPMLKAKAGDPVVALGLLDNEDATFTYVGVNKANNPLDISDVATAAVSSDAPTILTVDPPVKVSSAMHAVGPLGVANVIGVITWTDGSVGPFTVTLPVTVKANPQATGVVIDVGTPTAH